MSTLHSRGSKGTYYLTYWSDGRQYCKSLGTTVRADAERIQRDFDKRLKQAKRDRRVCALFAEVENGIVDIVDIDEAPALPVASHPEPVVKPAEPEQLAVTTVGDVVDAYLRHAETYYRKGNRPTSRFGVVQQAMKALHPYRAVAANEFGSGMLYSIQDGMVSTGKHRRTINDYVGVIRGMFKWAAGRELCPITVHTNLQAWRLSGAVAQTRLNRRTCPRLPRATSRPPVPT